MAVSTRIRGIRSPVPQGYVLGRTSNGSGDVELIPMANLGQELVATGSVGGGGSGAGLSDSGVTAGSYTLANITVNSKGIVTAAANGSLPNSGVTAGPYTLANITVDAHGIVTAAASGSLPNSGVSAGTYTNATITVDVHGIVTAASSGTAGGIQSVLVAGDILTGDQPDFVITVDGDIIEIPT